METEIRLGARSSEQQTDEVGSAEQVPLEPSLLPTSRADLPELTAAGTARRALDSYCTPTTSVPPNGVPKSSHGSQYPGAPAVPEEPRLSIWQYASSVTPGIKSRRCAPFLEMANRQEGSFPGSSAKSGTGKWELEGSRVQSGLRSLQNLSLLLLLPVPPWPPPAPSYLPASLPIPPEPPPFAYRNPLAALLAQPLLRVQSSRSQPMPSRVRRSRQYPNSRKLALQRRHTRLGTLRIGRKAGRHTQPQYSKARTHGVYYVALRGARLYCRAHRSLQATMEEPQSGERCHAPLHPAPWLRTLVLSLMHMYRRAAVCLEGLYDLRLPASYPHAIILARHRSYAVHLWNLERGASGESTTQRCPACYSAYASTLPPLHSSRHALPLGVRSLLPTAYTVIRTLSSPRAAAFERSHPLVARAAVERPLGLHLAEHLRVPHASAQLEVVVASDRFHLPGALLAHAPVLACGSAERISMWSGERFTGLLLVLLFVSQRPNPVIVQRAEIIELVPCSRVRTLPYALDFPRMYVLRPRPWVIREEAWSGECLAGLHLVLLSAVSRASQRGSTEAAGPKSTEQLCGDALGGPTRSTHRSPRVTLSARALRHQQRSATCPGVGWESQQNVELLVLPASQVLCGYLSCAGRKLAPCPGHVAADHLKADRHRMAQIRVVELAGVERNRGCGHTPPVPSCFRFCAWFFEPVPLESPTRLESIAEGWDPRILEVEELDSDPSQRVTCDYYFSASTSTQVPLAAPSPPSEHAWSPSARVGCTPLYPELCTSRTALHHQHAGTESTVTRAAAPGVKHESTAKEHRGPSLSSKPERACVLVRASRQLTPRCRCPLVNSQATDPGGRAKNRPGDQSSCYVGAQPRHAHIHQLCDRVTLPLRLNQQPMSRSRALLQCKYMPVTPRAHAVPVRLPVRLRMLRCTLAWPTSDCAPLRTHSQTRILVLVHPRWRRAVSCSLRSGHPPALLYQSAFSHESALAARHYNDGASCAGVTGLMQMPRSSVLSNVQCTEEMQLTCAVASQRRYPYRRSGARLHFSRGLDVPLRAKVSNALPCTRGPRARGLIRKRATSGLFRDSRQTEHLLLGVYRYTVKPGIASLRTYCTTTRSSANNTVVEHPAPGPVAVSRRLEPLRCDKGAIKTAARGGKVPPSQMPRMQRHRLRTMPPPLPRTPFFPRYHCAKPLHLGDKERATEWGAPCGAEPLSKASPVDPACGDCSSPADVTFCYLPRHSTPCRLLGGLPGNHARKPAERTCVAALNGLERMRGSGTGMSPFRPVQPSLRSPVNSAGVPTPRVLQLQPHVHAHPQANFISALQTLIKLHNHVPASEVRSALHGGTSFWPAISRLVCQGAHNREKDGKPYRRRISRVRVCVAQPRAAASQRKAHRRFWQAKTSGPNSWHYMSATATTYDERRCRVSVNLPLCTTARKTASKVGVERPVPVSPSRSLAPQRGDTAAEKATGGARACGRNFYPRRDVAGGLWGCMSNVTARCKFANASPLRDVATPEHEEWSALLLSGSHKTAVLRRCPIRVSTMAGRRKSKRVLTNGCAAVRHARRSSVPATHLSALRAPGLACTILVDVGEAYREEFEPRLERIDDVATGPVYVAISRCTADTWPQPTCGVRSTEGGSQDGSRREWRWKVGSCKLRSRERDMSHVTIPLLLQPRLSTRIERYDSRVCDISKQRRAAPDVPQLARYRRRPTRAATKSGRARGHPTRHGCMTMMLHAASRCSAAACWHTSQSCRSAGPASTSVRRGLQKPPHAALHITAPLHHLGAPLGFQPTQERSPEQQGVVLWRPRDSDAPLGSALSSGLLMNIQRRCRPAKPRRYARTAGSTKRRLYLASLLRSSTRKSTAAALPGRHIAVPWPPTSALQCPPGLAPSGAVRYTEAHHGCPLTRAHPTTPPCPRFQTGLAARE
ncbi:hypothetical protein GGX14DRAFT_385848 [Mycena pura]|uniref:Uncharacterized protein n=1 Tax=Mycena pura TaxID=153505 RepID=A0AAD6YRI0_9AGAR|nr:hypothetical protein GGX14DRAFT_385848 [Mycena pura]